MWEGNEVKEVEVEGDWKTEFNRGAGGRSPWRRDTKGAEIESKGRKVKSKERCRRLGCKGQVWEGRSGMGRRGRSRGGPPLTEGAGRG